MFRESHKFKKWSTTLCEKRWHCVLGFLKKLKPILHALRFCWNESKYERGVDASTTVGREWNTGDAENAESEDHSFDLRSLTTALQDNFFHRYVTFAIKADEVPDQKLAAWSEQCVCHRSLMPFFSEHKRRKMFEMHYGVGVRTCMMGGKCIPEIIDGQLEIVINDSWTELENEVMYGRSAQIHPLSPEKTELLVQEMSRARTAMFALLWVKLDYLFRLPCFARRRRTVAP